MRRPRCFKGLPMAHWIPAKAEADSVASGLGRGDCLFGRASLLGQTSCRQRHFAKISDRCLPLILQLVRRY